MNAKEALLQEQLEVNERLAELKIALDYAKANAAATGEFLKPHVYAAKLTNIGHLKAKLRRIQLDLHKLKRADGEGLDKNFVTVAKAALDPTTFGKLLMAAKIMQAGGQA